MYDRNRVKADWEWYCQPQAAEEVGAVKQYTRRKRLLVLVVFVALLAGVTLSFTVFAHKAADNQYYTEKIERGTIRTVVNATGTLQSVVTVQVGSQVSGQIEALYADYNSVVKRGQLLAKIDPRNFQAQVEDSKANLAAAEAHERSAEADLATQEANLASVKANVEATRVARDNDARVLVRNEDLFKSGLVAQNDLDTVKTAAEASAAKYRQALAAVSQAEAQVNSQKAQVGQALAQVAQAKADVDRSQLNLDYCNIYSPVDGVVISRSVDVGQTVAASLQAPLLFVIANDLTKMQVNASVDEADIGHVSDRSNVRFSVDAYPNETFSGKIAEIRLNPQTVQNVVTYSVIVDVNNTDLRLKPGMTANITITVDTRNDVVKIPNAALRYMPPGITRAKEAALEGDATEAGEVPSSARQPQNAATSAGKASSPSRSSKASNEAQASGSSEPGRNIPPHTASGAGASGFAELAPGQMWSNAQKIHFPPPPRRMEKPAVIWILDGESHPEPRHVLLGITDGTSTEMVSGTLKQGDQAIVADGSQSNSGANTTGLRSPFSPAPRRGR